MLVFDFVMPGFCAMQVNPREEHDVGDDDGLSCDSCCSARVSTLVEDMESGVDTLHDFVALLMWDAWRLGQHHEEPNLTSLEFGVMPCLEEDLVIVFLISMEVLVVVDAIVEDQEYGDSKPGMGM
jgi:hypothetical protein